MRGRFATVAKSIGNRSAWFVALSLVFAVEQSLAQTQTIAVRVSSNSDDVEEDVESGGVDFGSSDLEITDEGAPQVVGVRFLGVQIPPGATILSAAIQFTVDEADAGETSVRVFAELTPDARAFTSTPFDLSGRPRTESFADWNEIPPWNVDDAGPDQRTPDLSALVQEIVNLPDWDAGNAMVFGFIGNPGGQRTAESHNGESESAALLEVTFETVPGFRPDPIFAAVNDPPLPIALTLSRDCNAGQDVTYTLESSDPAVASPVEVTSAMFTAGGRFFQKLDLEIGQPGTTTLSAQPQGGAPAECGDISVTVEVIALQGVNVRLQSAGMEIGDTQQVQFVGDFGAAGRRLRTDSAFGTTYASSDPAVLTVDANGEVTAVGSGAADVTATNGAMSASATIVVAERLTRIAFIVGDIGLNEGDEAVAEHLNSLRFSGQPGQLDAAGQPAKVTPLDDDRFDAEAVEATFDLLVVSSTISPRKVGGSFRCRNVPLIFWGAGLHSADREGLTTAGGTSAGHVDENRQPFERHTELFILDNTHPITQGLPADDFVAVYDEPQLIAYASSGDQAVIPGGLAANAASLAEFEFVDESTITVAEAGGLRVNGDSRFLARRVGLWFTDNSFDNLNATGLTIFDNAVNWALASGRSVLAPAGVDLLASRLRICPPNFTGGGANEAQLALIGRAEFGCPIDFTSAASGTTYTSSNEGVATVDPDGRVTSVGLGVTTITATNGALTNMIDIEVAVDAGPPGFTVEIWENIGFTDDVLQLTLDYIAANEPTGAESGIQVVNFVDSGDVGEIGNDIPFPVLPPPAAGGSDAFIARLTGLILFPDDRAVRFGMSHDDLYSLEIDGQVAQESLCCSGAASIFDYTPPRAGLLPFELLFKEGAGGAYLEWTQIIQNEFVLVNDPNDFRSVRLFVGECVEGAVPPVFVGIMDGLGSAADTFISPLGEDVPFTQFGLTTDVPLDTMNVVGSAYTSPGATPTVDSFVSNGDGTHLVTLDTALTPGEWLRLDLEVAGAGTSSTTFSVWLAHQPLDVNQDGQTNIRDATAFGDVFRGSGEPRLININGDGAVNVRDATAFGNNWNGIAPLQAWRNTNLPPQP